MNSELSAIFFGLAAAACWGASDFSGGAATRRTNVFSVVIFSQASGAALLLILAVLLSEPLPALGDIMWGALAGVFGGLGLVVFYQALAQGRMGIVSPVTAITATALPVAVSLFTEGLPAAHQFAGIVVAFAAVWVVSRNGEGAPITLDDLRLPLLAGAGFGLFFTFIDRASSTSVIWPLVAVRSASIAVVLSTAALRRRKLGASPAQLPVIIFAGVFDTCGNALFALAAQSGRLDVATVLSSLYPAGTVLLAWLLLKEPITRRQWAGIGAALAAIVLIGA